MFCLVKLKACTFPRTLCKQAAFRRCFLLKHCLFVLCWIGRCTAVLFYRRASVLRRVWPLARHGLVFLPPSVFVPLWCFCCKLFAILLCSHQLRCACVYRLARAEYSLCETRRHFMANAWPQEKYVLKSTQETNRMPPSNGLEFKAARRPHFLADGMFYER